MPMSVDGLPHFWPKEPSARSRNVYVVPFFHGPFVIPASPWQYCSRVRLLLILASEVPAEDVSLMEPAQSVREPMQLRGLFGLCFFWYKYTFQGNGECGCWHTRSSPARGEMYAVEDRKPRRATFRSASGRDWWPPCRLVVRLRAGRQEKALPKRRGSWDPLPELKSPPVALRALVGP